jgi:hypothetical protein
VLKRSLFKCSAQQHMLIGVSEQYVCIRDESQNKGVLVWNQIVMYFYVARIIWFEPVFCARLHLDTLQLRDT